jgi:CHRD domain
MPWSKIAGVLVLAAVLGAIGCGSSKKSTSSSSATGSSSAYSPTAPATPNAPVHIKSLTFHVRLAGSNEVPKGAPNGSGIAVINFRPRTNQVCWKFSALNEVTNPTAAHIHEGVAGTSGPVVIAFAPPYRSAGCVGGPAPLLARIAATPQRYYVNIHNAKYPSGVVRAQL